MKELKKEFLEINESLGWDDSIQFLRGNIYKIDKDHHDILVTVLHTIELYHLGYRFYYDNEDSGLCFTIRDTATQLILELLED